MLIIESLAVGEVLTTDKHTSVTARIDFTEQQSAPSASRGTC